MKDSVVALVNWPAAAATNGCVHEYSVYGIALQSEIPLPLPARTPGALSQIELRTAPASFFESITRSIRLEQLDGSWYQLGRFEDRSSYLRWTGVGEFLVSGDGRRIFCRPFDVATTESFQVYLLGQALSYALVMRGFEPLHATVVVVQGDAVGFLGESGFGKSSLAACFLDAGYPILTDDLLLLREEAGRVVAYPGPARIKLFPRHARKVFGETANGIRMNPDTQKLIVPLAHTQVCSMPVPIKSIYSLAGPRDVLRRQATRFAPMSPRHAFLELLKNTFNRRIVDRDRLQRQLGEAARLANVLRIQKLSYARILGDLPMVRDAILANLTSQRVEAPACCE